MSEKWKAGPQKTSLCLWSSSIWCCLFIFSALVVLVARHMHRPPLGLHRHRPTPAGLRRSHSPSSCRPTSSAPPWSESWPSPERGELSRTTSRDPWNCGSGQREREEKKTVEYKGSCQKRTLLVQQKNEGVFQSLSYLFEDRYHLFNSST